ncbi:bestrophin family protein [Dechloromonas hortensis]|uniref:bestrophin family protein n=1 Tax=Dechloromonas hortensis TaxID=337779 RepID=UPI0012920121|nr:bestrophin family ion channel [Dechloromonas hortensis]
MIVRPRHHWFRLLFVWRGSVLPDIIGRLALVLAVSVISVLSREWWMSVHANSALSIPPFTLMGVALAIFLGFRNSVSYDRFWEARKQWGGLLVVARSLVRQVCSSLPGREYEPVRAATVRRVAAFAYALKHQLRQTDAAGDLALRLEGALLAEVSAARFQPQIILLSLAHLVADLRRQGQLSEMQLFAIDKSLNVLADTSGACERIASTPIPYTYRVLMNRTVMVYCLLLPVGLATSIGWLTPLIATFVAYTFLALEMIGEQIEEPFGTEANDLALDSLCHTIELSVCEMAGLAPLGQPPVVTDFVLT